MILNPVLTILVASSFPWSYGQNPHVEIARVVLEAAQSIDVPPLDPVPVEAAPTVRDIEFYYSDLTPIAIPAVEVLVTYDWRSPVIFDLP